jgi:hypothetical protein
MAIDQKAITLNSCTRIVNNVTTILACLDNLEAIKEQLAGAEIDLTTHETDIAAGSGIGHCDAATYKNIVNAFAPQIKVALEAYYSGSPTQQAWVAMQKARSG